MKICSVKLSAMGDIIHAMVALQFIKKHLPHAQIDWVVEESFKGVLENNPDIHAILCVNLKAIKQSKKALFTQYKQLKLYSKNHYDMIIDAQGLFKSALVSRIIGARVVVGFDKDSIREKIASFFYTKKVNIAYSANTIDRNVKVLCEPLGITVLPEDILAKRPFLYFGMGLENQYQTSKIIFVVGASKPNKVYPKEKFLKIAQLLGRKILVIWGNVQEYEDALWLSCHSPLVELDSKGDLDSLKAKIAHASLVIGGDTGPTHMAWGLNVHSITIFGNTPEYRNSFITPTNKVIKSPTSVNPLKLDKNDFSIRDIDAQGIVDMAQDILGDSEKLCKNASFN